MLRPVHKKGCILNHHANEYLPIKRFLPLFLLLSIVITSTSAESVYHFHGRIIDEDGILLSDVKISVYDGSRVKTNEGLGLLIKTTVSDPDGSIQISLDYGCFTLLFEKMGYVSVTKTYSEINVGDIDVGNITMQRSVLLYVPATNISVTKGSPISEELQLSNKGTCMEDVSLSVSSPTGWGSEIQ